MISQWNSVPSSLRSWPRAARCASTRFFAPTSAPTANAPASESKETPAGPSERANISVSARIKSQHCFNCCRTCSGSSAMSFATFNCCDSNKQASRQASRAPARSRVSKSSSRVLALLQSGRSDPSHLASLCHLARSSALELVRRPFLRFIHFRATWDEVKGVLASPG